MKKLITHVIAALWPPLFRGGLGLRMTSILGDLGGCPHLPKALPLG